MGDYERYVWTARHCPAEEEVHHGAGGVEEEFEHRPRVLGEGNCLVARGQTGGGGVDEDDGFPAVYLVEDRVEGFVPEVRPVVVRLHGEAVGMQSIEGVGDFVERALHIGHGEGGPKAELVWGAEFQFGREFVAVTGDFAGEGVVVLFEMGAGGGDANDGFCDVG